MQYKVLISDPEAHFITLEWTIPYVHQTLMHLQLPSWRPGRYELQNYAKNVRNFSIVNQSGQPVPFKKTNKDRWEVDTTDAKSLLVRYEYYANQYDAGASYVDSSVLYVNPVNCFMYVEGRADEEYTIELALPQDYTIACQMPLQGNTLSAKSFDYLADSPLIASASLQHAQFMVRQTTVHFWFQGRHNINLERLQRDTEKYAEAQVAIFGELPCTHYHFLYPMLDKPFRHGVEHLDSTVIVMGKADETSDESFYNDLLAISCHELFHLWNIKRIRPVEMHPYDFTRENYSTLGYVYEGVTTYYGDLMLLRSGVWSWEQYCASFNGDLQKHLDNPGRFNYSVAESSWDTWLDGYTPGIPGRKVSIYTEGMLAALIADLIIIHQSKGAHALDSVMRELYENYKEGNAYDESLYRSLLEKYAGISFENYFREVIWGKGKTAQWLNEALALAGCAIERSGAVARLIRKESSGEAGSTFACWTRN